MYPLLLTPTIRDYLWGGDRLKTQFHYGTGSAIAAEAWVLSCHADGPSTVKNGVEAGQPLPAVLSRWGEDALGKRAAAFPYFPLLIKLIDARDRLSVQVHPDDEYALKHEGEYGKTEMWYVIDCEEGAELTYGFNRPVSRDEFAARIRDNALDEVCNRVAVHPGDVFFIEAGTLHAIGAGILIAEVQQNSNTTYRVSDYGRRGADGKLRPLHIEKALEVTRLCPPTTPYGAIGKVTATPYGTRRRLAACDLFTADLLTLNGETTWHDTESFLSAVVLEGEVSVSDGVSVWKAIKGDSLFLPANCRCVVRGNAQLLLSRV